MVNIHKQPLKGWDSSIAGYVMYWSRLELDESFEFHFDSVVSSKQPTRIAQRYVQLLHMP